MTNLILHRGGVLLEMKVPNYLRNAIDTSNSSYGSNNKIVKCIIILTPKKTPLNPSVIYSMTKMLLTKMTFSQINKVILTVL